MALSSSPSKSYSRSNSVAVKEARNSQPSVRLSHPRTWKRLVRIKIPSQVLDTTGQSLPGIENVNKSEECLSRCPVIGPKESQVQSQLPYNSQVATFVRWSDGRWRTIFDFDYYFDYLIWQIRLRIFSQYQRLLHSLRVVGKLTAVSVLPVRSY